jgi:hypothetical protein
VAKLKYNDKSLLWSLEEIWTEWNSVNNKWQITNHKQILNYKL